MAEDTHSMLDGARVSTEPQIQRARHALQKDQKHTAREKSRILPELSLALGNAWHVSKEKAEIFEEVGGRALVFTPGNIHVDGTDLGVNAEEIFHIGIDQLVDHLKGASPRQIKKFSTSVLQDGKRVEKPVGLLIEEGVDTTIYTILGAVVDANAITVGGKALQGKITVDDIATLWALGCAYEEIQKDRGTKTESS